MRVTVLAQAQNVVPAGQFRQSMAEMGDLILAAGQVLVEGEIPDFGFWTGADHRIEIVDQILFGRAAVTPFGNGRGSPDAAC